MTAKVIQFPRDNPRAGPTREELAEAAEMIQQEIIDMVASELLYMFFQRMSDYHVPITDDDGLLKDEAFFEEVMASIIERQFGVRNPIQSVADHMFDIVKDVNGDSEAVLRVDEEDAS